MNIRTEMNERDMDALAVIAASSNLQEAKNLWKGRSNEFGDIVRKLKLKQLCSADSVHVQLTEAAQQMLDDYEHSAPYFKELKRIGVAVFLLLYKEFGHEAFTVADASEVWNDKFRIRAELKQFEKLGWVRVSRSASPRFQFTVEALAPSWTLAQDSLRPLITFTPPLHLLIKRVLKNAEDVMAIDEIAAEVEEAIYVVRSALYAEVAQRRSVIRQVAGKPRSLFLVDRIAWESNTELREQLAFHFPEG